MAIYWSDAMIFRPTQLPTTAVTRLPIERTLCSTGLISRLSSPACSTTAPKARAATISQIVFSIDSMPPRDSRRSISGRRGGDIAVGQCRPNTLEQRNGTGSEGSWAKAIVCSVLKAAARTRPEGAGKDRHKRGSAKRPGRTPPQRHQPPRGDDKSPLDERQFRRGRQFRRAHQARQRRSRRQRTLVRRSTGSRECAANRLAPAAAVARFTVSDSGEILSPK